MIYPNPCSDPFCNLAHKTFGSEKLHRGSLYVQLLRTSSNDGKIVVLSYKTFYYLTEAQKQKKENLIQNKVLKPMARAQMNAKHATAPIYFAAARSRHEYSLIQKNSATQEIHIASDGPLIDAINKEGALILEKIHQECSLSLRNNPIKDS